MKAVIHLFDTGDEIAETTLCPADAEWVTPTMAAHILCYSAKSFYGLFRPQNNYFEVRRKLRGTCGKLSPRGQGHLFRSDDVYRILKIKRAIRCTTKVAARVFAAERLGKL